MAKRTELSSSEEDVDDERESHDSEKADSRESHDSSPTPFFKLKKGGGLFRGTKQEKVCHICEKPGDTVKCRGPCCGTFHLECVSKSLAAKENMNATMPMNFGIKNKTDDDASVEMKERDGRGVHELTNSSELEDKLSKPVICTAKLVGHDVVLDEKEDRPVSRKRKRLASEEEICVANKKDAKQGAVFKNDRDEESKENETVEKEISVQKEEDDVEVNEKREGCRQNVESVMNQEGIEEEALEEMKMDEESKENETVKKEISVQKEEDDVEVNEKREGCRQNVESVMNQEGVEEEALEEMKVDIDNANDTKVVKNDNTEVEVKGNEKNKGSEKDLVTQKGNGDIHRKEGEKEEESNLDESRARMNETAVCEEKDKCKRATRGFAKKRVRESSKEIRADGEVKKETEISPEDRDKDERKERIIMKKKDKEEKGKDDVTEDKTVTDAAAEFRCKDCKEGRNPPCFACGRIREEKTGRDHRQRCAVGKCKQNSWSEYREMLLIGNCRLPQN
jgi:hypothetical protein